MPVMKLLVADRTAVATYLRGLFDDQVGGCTLEFYDGAILAGPASAITTQTKLGTLPCSDPLGSEAAGAVTFGPITQDNAADASSDAGGVTFALLRDGAGVARAVFDVTNNAGTGTIKVNTTTIVAGGPILVSSFVITIGGA